MKGTCWRNTVKARIQVYPLCRTNEKKVHATAKVSVGTLTLKQVWFAMLPSDNTIYSLVCLHTRPVLRKTKSPSIVIVKCRNHDREPFLSRTLSEEAFFLSDNIPLVTQFSPALRWTSACCWLCSSPFTPASSECFFFMPVPHGRIQSHSGAVGIKMTGICASWPVSRVTFWRMSLPSRLLICWDCIVVTTVDRNQKLIGIGIHN